MLLLLLSLLLMLMMLLLHSRDGLRRTSGVWHWLPNNRFHSRLLLLQLRGPRLRGRREVTLAMGVDAGNLQKATRDMWPRPVARSCGCGANRRLFNTATPVRDGLRDSAGRSDGERRQRPWQPSVPQLSSQRSGIAAPGPLDLERRGEGGKPHCSQQHLAAPAQ